MSHVLMGFAGDVIVDRAAPLEAFAHVREVLRVPDVLFANLEGSYSDDPHPSPGAGLVVGPRAHNLDVYGQVGFNVMSMAGNHTLDIGYQAMLETCARLRARGVQTCGAGESEPAAREPARFTAKGVRVAILAYGSVFPMGYEAHGTRAGIAPVRAYNFYRDPVPNYLQPGCAAALVSVPDEVDCEKLAADIHKARREADVVVTSFHWGDYARPYHLTDHERRTARYAIEHGADLVVGHHHHALRGMEWYRGKPILYGLGHFVADLRIALGEDLIRAMEADGGEARSYRLGPREGWPLLPLHPDTRMTVLAWARAESGGIRDIGFLPCQLDPQGAVHPLHVDSEAGGKVVRYLEQCNRTQQLNGALTAAGAISFAGFPTIRVIPREDGRCSPPSTN